jgi:hypothetical protein
VVVVPAVVADPVVIARVAVDPVVAGKVAAVVPVATAIAENPVGTVDPVLQVNIILPQAGLYR